MLLLVPVWEACRASSAAPLFFTSFKDYVDGGVMANNPCEYAMAAISQYNFSQMEEESKFSLAVSMGTGHDPQMEVENINTFDEEISDRMKILVDLFSKNVSNIISKISLHSEGQLGRLQNGASLIWLQSVCI